MPGGAAGTGGGISGGSKAFAIVMVSFAAFGGMLFGYDTGTINGILAMPNWLQTFGSPQPEGYDCPYTPDPGQPCYDISTGRKSLVVSILSLGTFLGALFAAPLGDWAGRRMGLILSCSVFCLGVGMQLDTNIDVFIAGRVFAGLGVGLVSCLVPMYQSECSPKWVRGAVVGCYQWAITIGLLLSAIIDNATKDRPDHSAYRIPISIQFIWAAILSGGMALLPESPRYLIRAGKDARARKSLARLMSSTPDSPEVEAEFQDIHANLEAEREVGGGWLECFSNQGRNRFRVLTGMALQALQQLTGINFIFYYGTTFFKNSGISNPFTITIITNCVNVAMTVPGILLIDRAGRRMLLLIGAAGMCVCEFIVAIVGVTISVENLAGQKVLIAFVCVYIAFFAATWGPIAWVVTGEIYSLAIRAKGLALSTASNWLLNFAIAYSTPYLVDSGPGDAGLGAKVFFIWGSCCALCFLFTFFFIPETKGLSLEQVDILYQNSSILKSNSYRKQLIQENVRASDEDAIVKITSTSHHRRGSRMEGIAPVSSRLGKTSSVEEKRDSTVLDNDNTNKV